MNTINSIVGDIFSNVMYKFDSFDQLSYYQTESYHRISAMCIDWKIIFHQLKRELE